MGILYQNSIAALYLGRMCDASHRPDRERVISVRVEAPQEVDDTVVSFTDDHCIFIQAKENVILQAKSLGGGCGVRLTSNFASMTSAEDGIGWLSGSARFATSIVISKKHATGRLGAEATLNGWWLLTRNSARSSTKSKCI